MLAACVADHPEEPWLIYQGFRGWTWHSYAQVADQVAQRIDALDTALNAAPISPPHSRSIKTIAFDGRCDPDHIASDLAAQALSCRILSLDTATIEGLDLLRFADLWLGGEERATPVDVLERLQGRPQVDLPAALSRLESWRAKGQGVELRQRLHRRSAHSTLLCTDDQKFLRPVKPAEIFALAERVDSQMPPLPERPIIFGSLALHGVSGRVQMVWGLLRRAAWAFEHQRDAQLEALLWVRPHVAWIAAHDLLDWLEVLGERRVRRHSRLCAIVVVGRLYEEATGAHLDRCLERLRAKQRVALVNLSELFSRSTLAS